MATLTKHPRNSSRMAIIDNEQYTQNVRGLRPGPSGRITVEGDLVVTGTIIGAVVGAASLADTLVVGNTTGANDIILSAGTAVTTANGRLDQLGTNVRLTSSDNLLITGQNIVSIDSSFGSVSLIASVGNIDIVGQNYNVTAALDFNYSGRDLIQNLGRDATITAVNDITLTGDRVDFNATNMLASASGTQDWLANVVNFAASTFMNLGANTAINVFTPQTNFSGNIVTTTPTANHSFIGASLSSVVTGAATFSGATATNIGVATGLTTILGNGVTINSLPGSGQLTGSNWTVTSNNNITLNAATGITAINTSNVDINSTGPISLDATGNMTQNAANITTTATNLLGLSGNGNVTLTSTGAAITVSANTTAVVSGPVTVVDANTRFDQFSPIINVGSVADTTQTNVRGVNLDVNVSGNIDFVAPNFDVVADISSVEGSEFQVNIDRLLSVSPVTPTVSSGTLATGSTNICGRWDNAFDSSRFTFNPPLPAGYIPTIILTPRMNDGDNEHFLRWSVYNVSNTGFNITSSYVRWNASGPSFDPLVNQLDWYYHVMCIQ